MTRIWSYLRTNSLLDQRSDQRSSLRPN